MQATLKVIVPHDRLQKATDAINALAWLTEIGAVKSASVIEFDTAPLAKFVSDGVIAAVV